MHVLESYALQDNFKIDEPFIYEKYFPMAVQGKYITIDTSSDDESNKYSHWVMVLDFLAPHLKNLGVTVVQLGNKEDQQIPGCYIAVGQTDNNQKAYVIKNSHLHISANSLSLQIASGYNKRIVALFGNSYYEQFKPYWSSENDVTVLKGYRSKPSFTGFAPMSFSHCGVDGSKNRLNIFFDFFWIELLFDFLNLRARSAID